MNLEIITTCPWLWQLRLHPRWHNRLHITYIDGNQETLYVTGYEGDTVAPPRGSLVQTARESDPHEHTDKASTNDKNPIDRNVSEAKSDTTGTQKTSNTKAEETEPTPEPRSWAQYKAECAAERKAKAKAEYIAQFGSYPWSCMLPWIAR